MEQSRRYPEKPVRKKDVPKDGLTRWFNVLRALERLFMRWWRPFRLHGYLPRPKYNDRSYIFVSNHYSIYDIIYPAFVTDKPVHYVAKSDLWEKRFLRWLCDKCEAIPVNRDGKDVKPVMEMMKVLKKGGIVTIFPEGTRNHSYESLLPFAPGAATLSIKTRTPIVPYCVVRKCSYVFRRNHVVFGEPIEFSEYYGVKITDEIARECDEKLRETIWKMREDFLAGKYKKSRGGRA
ncbi:MAG: 1-acyl-sn-glycerol-3-phosphate acyltransferase [Clostridia bacterium]|nr:1-acyl-sn-glycerol-3-phosphate acyltransferase [Clostridia bacterium]